MHAEFYQLATDYNEIPSQYRNFRAREFPLLLGVNNEWGRTSPMRLRHMEGLESLDTMVTWLEMGAVLSTVKLMYESDEL